MTAKQVISTIKSYSIITLGLLCYVTAWVVFVLPNGIVGGGVSGISAVIQYCTGFPVAYTYFILNVVLLLLALKILGKGFGAKTVYAVLVCSALFEVLPMVIPQEIINELAVSNGRLLCAIIGGGLSGVGVALTFTQGGSTGGTDIIALIINKFRSISPGKIIVSIDIIIIATSLLIPGDGTWGYRVATLIYGYILAGVFSISLDTFLSGDKQSVQIFIFSNNYEEIADKIVTLAHRGATIFDAQGWYTKENKKVVMVITRKHDYSIILKIVREIDPQAFISVGNVMGVYGSGFEKNKK